MRVGDVFKSYAEFEVALSQYKKSNFVDFYIKDSKTAKSQINRYPKLANTSEQLKYYYVKLACVHGGSYKKRKSCRDLRNTSTMRQGCEAFIYLIANANGDAIEITRMNDEHNHEKSETLFSHLPSQRKVTSQEKTEMLGLMEFKANKKLIQNEMKIKTSKFKGLKDNVNIHTTGVYESQLNWSIRQSSTADCRESTKMNDLNMERRSYNPMPNISLHQTYDNSCSEGNVTQEEECHELNTTDSSLEEVVTLSQDHEYSKPNTVSISRSKRKISFPKANIFYKNKNLILSSKKPSCEAMKSKGKSESELESFEKVQIHNKTVEATQNFSSVSEQLVKIKENYYERKLKLKELEIANNQQFHSKNLIIQHNIADALSNIIMLLNDKKS